MVDALRSVTTMAEKVFQKKRKGIRYCSIVTLGVPETLCRALKSYFQYSMLPYDFDEREMSYNIIGEVPQGPVL